MRMKMACDDRTLRKVSLSTSGDLLTQTVTKANQSRSENTVLTEEAEKRYATTASRQMMQNAFTNQKVAIGANYTPVLKELYSVSTDMFVGATDFVELNPALIRAVTAEIGVIGLSTAGLAAFKAKALLAAAAS